MEPRTGRGRRPQSRVLVAGATATGLATGAPRQHAIRLAVLKAVGRAAEPAVEVVTVK